MFGLESPNFTDTSTPTFSTVTLEMTSPATSGDRFVLKNRRKWHFRQLGGEFLGNSFNTGSQNFTTLSGTTILQKIV